MVSKLTYINLLYDRNVEQLNNFDRRTFWHQCSHLPAFFSATV